MRTDAHNPKPVIAPALEGDEILTVPTLAERLKCSQRHVLEQVKAGALPCMRIGRSLRFRWSAVLAAVSR